MALLITLGAGVANSLRLKVPAKGEQNWSNDFKEEFANKIVFHDHTGNGKGAKIGTDALEDDAVTGAKLSANLGDLLNVSVGSAVEGNILQLDASGNWIGSSVDFDSNILTYNPQNQVDDIAGWSPVKLDTVHLNLIGYGYNLADPLNPFNTGGPQAPGEPPSFYPGLEAIILNVYNYNAQGNVNTLTLPPMKNCIIRANCNLQLEGAIDNCTIITTENIIMGNGDTITIHNSNVKAKAITNVTAIGTRTLFNNSTIHVNNIKMSLTSLNTNSIKLIDSIVKVDTTLSNVDLSTGDIVQLDITNNNYGYLQLENTELNIDGRMEGMFGFVLDSNSHIIAENYAERNKEIVELQLNRRDIGLFTGTLKNVIANLEIDLDSSTYDLDSNDVLIDTISSWKDNTDGNVTITNYKTKDGIFQSPNTWRREFWHYFNREVIFDNVQLNVLNKNYVYEGVAFGPNNKTISWVVLPRRVRNSTINMVYTGSNIEGSYSTGCFHLSPDYDMATEHSQNARSAPERFRITHIGEVEFVNSTFKGDASERKHNESIFTNLEDDVRPYYYLDTSNHSSPPQTPIRITNSTFMGTDAVFFGQNIVMENVEVVATNNIYLPSYSRILHCKFTTAGTFRIYDRYTANTTRCDINASKIHCNLFLSSKPPVEFAGINITYSEITTATAYLYGSSVQNNTRFYKCNITCTDSWTSPGTQTVSQFVFYFCTINANRWAIRYPGTSNTSDSKYYTGGFDAIYKDSNVIIKQLGSPGARNATDNSTSIINQNSRIEIDYAYADSNNAYNFTFTSNYNDSDGTFSHAIIPNTSGTYITSNHNVVITSQNKAYTSRLLLNQLQNGEILKVNSSGDITSEVEKSIVKIYSSGSISRNTAGNFFSSSTIPSGCYAQITVRATGYESSSNASQLPATMILGPGNVCSLSFYETTASYSMYLAGQRFYKTSPNWGTITVDYVVYQNS